MSAKAKKDNLGLVILMHNDSVFALDCLESAAREWAHATNLITVLINGSTDGTDQIAHNWAQGFPSETRPYVYVSTTNRGPLGGFVRLLELTKCTQVAVLHGDDFLLPGFYAASTAALDSTHSPTIFVRDFSQFYVGEDGRWQSTNVVERLLVSRIQAWNRFAFSVYNIAAIGGAIVPVDFCLRLLISFHSELLCAEDWLLFTEALEAGGRILRLPGVAYGYRVHRGNTTQTDLQSFSVGYIRGRLSRPGRGVLGWIARQQSGRELVRIKSQRAYILGLQAGAGIHMSSGTTNTVVPSWRSLPFLALLTIFRSTRQASHSQRA